ncbi:hypothetical protein V8J82_11015 [Gymnodinialimonas sp. 2305UL16-5]|uniref:hypothetical protein n=1 Tax=Gymnodinialimonas mytili TaxID=3126503 RepID=UPI0030A7DD66
MSSPASAGPWARAQGDGFISFQISAAEAPSDVMLGLWEPEIFTSTYFELGLGRDLTLGADIGFGEETRQAVGFVRYTLTPSDATWQFAVDAGAGMRRVGEQESDGLIRIGASLGRGFGDGGDAWYMPLSHQGGWLTLDGVGLYNLGQSALIWQVEGTAGFRLSDRFAAIFQIKVEDWPDADLLATASPSIVYDFTETTSVQLGVRAPLTGSDNLGVSLALWHEF